MIKSRVLRLSMWALLALLLAWLIGWLALPPLLKWQLQTRGSALLGRELSVGEVRFAPMTLQLTLRDLAVAGAPGDADAAPQLQIERLFIDLDARSLLRLAPVLAALELDAPRLRLARRADGSLDIDDLRQRFATAPDQPADAAPARFALFNLRVADGQIRIDDRTVDRQHLLRDLQLDLPFLSSLPDHLQVKVEPRLAFELDGSRFDSQGRATPFAEGRASQLQLRVDALALQPLWAYLPSWLPLQLSGGRLSAELALNFEQPRAQPPRAQLQGWVELAELQAQPRGQAPLLGVRRLRVELDSLLLAQRRVAIKTVQIDGAQLQLRREASGRLELQRLAEAMRPPAAVSAAAPAAPIAVAPSVASAASAASTASAASAASAGTVSTNPAPPWQVQVAELQLHDAQVLWTDATLQPAAQAQLHGIELQLQQLHWPFDADAALRVQARLRAQDQELGRLQAEAAFTDRHAKLSAQLADIDAAVAAPYLRPWLRAQARAKLNATATLDWAGGDAPRLALGLPSLRIDAFELVEPVEPARRTNSPALQWQRLEVRELQADLLQRQVSVGAVQLQAPSAALARDAQGRFDIERWWAGPAAAEATRGEAAAVDAGANAATGGTAAPPWRLALRELQLDGGKLRLADAALPGGPLQLDGVRVSAQALTLPDSAPVALQLAARLATGSAGSMGRGSRPADAAQIDWRGKVAAQPLAAQGQLRLERVPVHVFEPYFGAALPVSLQRLEAGYKGQVELRQQPQGLDVRLRGDALLADLQLMARDTPPTELLRWNALQLNGLVLALRPAMKPRVEIAALKLADFFARLEVNESGRLNLQTLAAAPSSPPRDAAAARGPANSAAPTAPSERDAAATAAATDTVLSRLPVELLIESTQFSNGRVDFNDRFVRPNYRADLTELNGDIGRLDSRSRDMATLQLRGRVAGSGALEIGGAVNPTVIPPALDIKASATDIELPGFTPYAAKYAGYPIERGKLSMNVAYKVQADGRLEASNQIIVNQLTFGVKTDSPDATKLPVPLLVALLQDKNGVIDLDLPLTGSLSDPQFNLGALIWKVIVNLFTKIVSSPFAAIEGGSGKNLSRVEFRPGTAVLTAEGEQVVAKVVKALGDRPQLKLGIVAAADPTGEAEAMREAAFAARLRDEQRRERARGALGGAALDAALPPLSEEQRDELVRRIYDDTKLPDKPRNFIGLAKDIPVAEMQARLMAAMPIDDASARALAQQRGRSVRDALIAKGLDSARLFLGEPQLHAAEADNAPWVPQAQLTLSVK